MNESLCGFKDFTNQNIEAFQDRRGD